MFLNTWLCVGPWSLVHHLELPIRRLRLDRVWFDNLWNSAWLVHLLINFRYQLTIVILFMLVLFMILNELVGIGCLSINLRWWWQLLISWRLWNVNRTCESCFRVNLFDHKFFSVRLSLTYCILKVLFGFILISF